MKIITNQQWLAQDIFDLVHLFIQDSKLDEDIPYFKQEGLNILLDEIKKELKQNYGDEKDRVIVKKDGNNNNGYT